METSSLIKNISQIVGESGLLSDAESSDYSYDDCVPKAVILPATVQEMQNVLQCASEQNLSVMPAGAGTKLGIGNIANNADIVIATTQLNKVVEYEPADLTVTVEAGIRLIDLQNQLAEHRQFLPLNPPYANNCTIGGIVATNSSGPLRLQYGTARNLVLGMKVVHASGTTVKSGGKVVKNVAGYDLNKLYIGSYGTLGIISEVTLKLAPLPIQEAIITAQFQNTQDAVKTGLNVVSSQSLPSYVILMVNNSLNLYGEKLPTIIVGYSGEPETVSWQLNDANALMQQNGAIGVHIVEQELVPTISNTIEEYPTTDSKSDKVIVKINIKRTDLAEFVDNIYINTYEVMALLGNGVLYLKIPIDSATDFQELAITLTQMRKNAAAVGGNLIIESAPSELKRHIDVWGPIGDTLNLMKQIKKKFDSTDLLNPGRFVSGI